ncbi:hypothetical protein [Variovorax ginsengisoli]|uniref:Uncharacterized protein n=1 Tax=Variovorax ginsengisoli TaxID=363844 RepID=A0ABT8SHH2_9BURK|nr:hypothetical protein [Variovorax ginsengisoli]MDN8618287.1 hypothetical protein [Variovorax ginsengisoli]MDO1537457.1 hypothetical protein [Variovorax ginsengisoli]
MFEGYKARIQSYCEEAGIEVPVGFGRHAAGRYVAIDDESSPPKLVATTWPNRKDVVNYLVSLAAGRRTRILDFKDRRELSFDGKASLLRGAVF